MRKCLHLSVFALVALAACSKTDGHLSIEELSKKKLWAYSATVDCVNQDACPNEVAMLSTPEPDDGKAGFCTGTMVGEATLLTNAHCLPKKIRQAKASCDDQIWAVFPKTRQHDALTIECQEVLFVTPGVDYEGGDTMTAKRSIPDVALVRLRRRPERGFLRMSREGFRNGDGVTFYKSNPDSKNEGHLQAHIEKTECHFSTKTQINSEMLSEKEAKDLEVVRRQRTVVFDDCGSRGGNSGSAAIVGSEVRGVLFAGSKLSVMASNFAYGALQNLETSVAQYFRWELR